ncbi:efflux RND transporter periplasmic adaptor subunit [Paraherbaspirillum soli]|uniref:Efflux RND transporter periplasmic adaptor subunit n=1 Tax=Paraherbaspirillum soli TaxID=631222 RepID=A0ABW0MBJ8_9BURK
MKSDAEVNQAANSSRAAAAQDPALRELATLLQLGRRAREADNIEVLGFVAVNESRQLFQYRQAALGRVSAVGQWLPGAVMAVSGLPQPDPQAPYVQWLAQVFAYLAKQDIPEPGAAVRALNARELPELLARDWAAWLPEYALLLPLHGPDRHCLGNLLLAREQPWDAHEMLLAAELAHAYGHALARFAGSDSWQHKLRLWALPAKSRWKIALAALAVCLLPVRLSVLAPAEVVPLEPFPVRAPLDGVVDNFHVRPSQQVKAGDPLFDLDTTVLRSRLGVARKAYDVASEEYRQAAQLALNDEKSKLDMTLKKGSLEQKAVELDYSKELLARVQIKAPRDGVAVFADVNDWQGRALSVGERVLTLADPAKVELAVSLPVAEAFDFQPDAAVTLYPNGALFASYDGTLSSAAYRAEPTPDGVLAYRLKVRFDRGQALPRLGLMGTAKVRGGWAPLIYIVLRRPLAAARQWLGW